MRITEVNKLPMVYTLTKQQDNIDSIGRGSCKTCHRERPAQCHEGQGEMAAGNRQGGVSRITYRAFLSALAQDLDGIRKTTKGTPSPQLHDYKKGEAAKSLNNSTGRSYWPLFRRRSFTCTEGYVPAAYWQFPGESRTIPF